MSAPWEKYQDSGGTATVDAPAPSQDGPWAKYNQPPANAKAGPWDKFKTAQPAVPASGTVKLDPLQQAQIETGQIDPSEEGFDSRYARLPKTFSIADGKPNTSTATALFGTAAESVPSSIVAAKVAPKGFSLGKTLFRAGKNFLKGAAVGEAAGGGPEDPVADVGGLILGAASALTAGAATDWVEDKLLKAISPKIQQQLSIAQQEHPAATIAGNVLGGGAGFKYQPLKTVRGIMDIATGKLATDAAKATASQAGLGVATGVALPLIQGRKPTEQDVYGMLAQSLLLGGSRFEKAPSEPTPASVPRTGPSQPAANAPAPAPPVASAADLKAAMEFDPGKSPPASPPSSRPSPPGEGEAPFDMDAMFAAGSVRPPETVVDIPDGHPQPVARDQIVTRPDLMQFKREVSGGTEGEAEDHARTIGGGWNPDFAHSLTLWEPKNPADYGLAPGEKYIVADGHGRLAHYDKTGSTGLLSARVLREADGITANEARVRAAEKNIANNTGTIYDQTKFLRNVAETVGQTEALARARQTGIGRGQAAAIAFNAGPALYDSFVNEQINPEATRAIANAAPARTSSAAAEIKSDSQNEHKTNTSRSVTGNTVDDSDTHRVAGESTQSIIARTKPGDERDAAFAARAAANKAIQKSLKEGDVIIDDEGNRRVVDQVFKNGDVWTVREDGKGEGEWKFDASNGDTVERKSGSDKEERRSQSDATNESLQRLGIKYYAQGKTADYIVNLLKATQLEAGTKAADVDLFGSDDSAMKEMEAQAERASTFQREIREQISAVSGAVKKPDVAAKLGVNVKDPQAVAGKVAQLKTELQRWDNWPLQPDLVAKVKGQSPRILTKAIQETPQQFQKRTEHFRKTGEVLPPPKPIPDVAKSELFPAAETPFNLTSEKSPPSSRPSPEGERAVATTQFGDEKLAQDELFAIQKVVEHKDPAKSADAATALYGGTREAIRKIGSQLAVMAADPKSYKSFGREQRQRLQDVLTLLRQRGGGKKPMRAGPGAMTAGEFENEQPPSPPHTFGISREARTQMAEAGETPMVQAGEGMNAGEQVDYGRELLARGFNAPAALEHFEKTQQVSPDGIMAIRAYGENLYQRQVHAENQFGTASHEFTEAYQKFAEWNKRSNALNAAAHKIFGAFRGVTDVDTGTFSGLQRAFEREHDKPLPPELANTAKSKVNQIKKINSEVAASENNLTGGINRELNEGDELTRFGNNLDKLAYQILKANPFMSRDELVGALHTRLQKQFPEFTPELIEDALSKYGDVKLPSKDPVKLKLQDYKAQMLSRGQLRSMQAGEAPERTGYQRPPMTEAQRVLRKQVEEATRKGGYKVTDPERQLRSALAAAKTRTSHAIDDLQREIDRRERTVKTQSPSPSDAELVALKQKLAGVRAIHTQVFGDVDLTALKEKFAGKTDHKFTLDEAKQIWQLAKARYLERGVTDIDRVAVGLAKDLNLYPEQIVRAFTQTRALHKLADDLWYKQAEQRRLKADVELWVKYADNPALYNFMRLLPNFFFSLAVFGHGAVWGGTHAPIHILTPQSWPVFFPNYFASFKNMVSKGAHERYLRDIANSPDYVFWKRRGLEIDVNRAVDQYASREQGVFFGALGRAGNRGFDSLKGLRLGLARQYWTALEPELRNEESAAKIIDWVNHSTGALGSKSRISSALKTEGVRSFLFAPALYGSRIATVSDAIKAASIGLRRNASPETRAMSVEMNKRLGAMLGLFGGALLLNNAILSTTGSNSRVNFTDPTKPDFLAFKGGNGMYVGVGSGFLGMARLLGRLYKAETDAKKPGLGQLDDRSDDVGKIMGQYVRGLLSPLAARVADLVTGENIMKRPLPAMLGGNRNVTGSASQQIFKPQLSMKEYLGSALLPIPGAEAWENYYEELRKNGLSESDARRFLKSAGAGVAGGLTGFRLGTVNDQKLDDVETIVSGLMREVRNVSPSQRDGIRQKFIDHFESLSEQGKDLSKAALSLKIQDAEAEDALTAYQAADDSAKVMLAQQMADKIQKDYDSDKLDVPTTSRMVRLVLPYLKQAMAAKNAPNPKPNGRSALYQ